MSFEKVKDRYVAQIAKQLRRRNRRDSNSFTSNENKAIIQYGRAVQQLQALINAPKPAWYGLVLEKTIRL